MFGTYRFLLAFLVAASHVGLLTGYNLGVFGVVHFYVLSGYVMTYLLENVYQKQNLKLFYIDRLYRIYPLYFVFTALTVFFSIATPFRPLFYSWTQLIQNLLLIPVGFSMFAPREISYLPPTWTLSVEFQFYLILPLLLRFKKLEVVALFSSLAVFILAVMGILPTDDFTFRLLPGVLVFFILGSLLYRSFDQKKKREQKLLAITGESLIIILFAASMSDLIRRPFTLEALTAALSAVLSITFLAHIKAKKPSIIKIDQLLGNLSYPLYLSHFLIIWIYLYLTQKYNILLPQQSKFVICIAVSLIVSYLTYLFIEKPLQQHRRKQRAKWLDSIEN